MPLPTTPAAFAALSGADLVAALPDGAVLFGPDRVVVDVNPAFLGMIGLPREAVVGLSPPHRWWPAPPAPVAATGQRAERPVTLTRADGSTFPALMTEAPLPGGVGVLCLVRDNSDRVAMEHTLRGTPTGLANAFESAPTAMIILTGEERPGVLARSNHAFRALTDHAEDELAGQPLGSFAHPEDRAIVEATIAGAIAMEEPVRETLRLRRRDGATRWVQLSVRGVRVDGLGLVEYLLAHLEDVTDQRALEADLARQAATDAMTGLLNGRSFEARLDDAVEHGLPAVVLAIDLDSFKAVNDEHGHQAGDQVLRTVAARLQAAARASDAVARVGGDEFAMLCLGVTDEESCDRVVQRVQMALAEAPAIAASVGAALVRPGRTAADVLQRADKAMYARKRGR
ncbi:hypothetical protein DSM112329_03778 [Paraconexibacter sp. AEG42_29]|uniref:Diguanylate cyclase n=1 Tax=Paraconexibacter sp. AEG42_29 TaxID=2997339 RepID=A0AAU7AZ15_9ACTN